MIRLDLAPKIQRLLKFASGNVNNCYELLKKLKLNDKKLKYKQKLTMDQLEQFLKSAGESDHTIFQSNVLNKLTVKTFEVTNSSGMKEI